MAVVVLAVLALILASACWCMHRNARRNFAINTAQLSFRDFFQAVTRPPILPIRRFSPEEQVHLYRTLLQNMAIMAAHLGLMVIILKQFTR